ncbi:MAG TPA: universal stress protein [Desulfotignum sp.]|jgi:nucleotide-binding universal stress UspA family protein|nr:universal stress protein [Desulfotignum sp.]
MNRKINKILACVDFSEYAKMVVACAVELASAPDMQIVVLNVINQRDIDGIQMAAGYFPTHGAVMLSVEDCINDWKKDRQNRLKELVREHFFEDKSKMHLMVDTGIPYERILKTADDQDVDLIVIANKGRGNLSRVLFGSAAEKVFRHSKVPVVCVRDPEKFKQGRKP